MGLIFRKRVRLFPGTWLNFSRRGVSRSTRVGPFTFNSRGTRSMDLPLGFSYRWRRKSR